MSAHYKALTRRTQPDEIAVFPLNGTVMLPCCDLPLNIFEPRYLNFANFEQDADLHDPMPVPKAFKNLGGERATLTVAMKALAKTLNVNVDWDSLADIPLDQLVDQAAMISPFKSEDKQSLLEAGSGEERRRLLTGLMHLYAANGSGENPRPTN